MHVFSSISRILSVVNSDLPMLKHWLNINKLGLIARRTKYSIVLADTNWPPYLVINNI
jgi:hypothetical protein